MSLVTYPVATAPRVFLPRSFSAGLQTNTRGFASPFGGSEQVADMLNDRWVFALELAARNHDEAASVEAFVAAMRGMSNTTNLYHFGRPTPRGTLAGSPALVAPAAQGAASITVGAVAGQTLRAGDMLGIGGLLVQVAADCVADASGAMVVPLVNRLRRAVAGLSRASTATYIDDAGVLQTAGVNVPRFQGGALLVEPAGTNLLTQSNRLWDADAWVSGAPLAGFYSVTESSAVSDPTGAGASVARFVASASTAVLFLRKPITISPGAYAPSIWVYVPAQAGLTSWQMQCDAGDLDIGMRSASQPIGKWVCVKVPALTVSATRSFLDFNIQVNGADPPSPDFTFYATTAQFEAGATHTSYIPTTTAPATRAADVVTPVVWDRPTGTFRLASQPRVVYLGGYAEAVAMDFVEHIA